MYDLILFDFDFTLVDSSRGIVASIQYALERLKYSVPSDDTIKNTIGLPLKDAFFGLSGVKSEKQYNLFKHYFMESSQKVMCQSTVLFKDTVDTLRKLKEDKRRLAIVSAKDKKTIYKIAEQHSFLEFIDIIIGEHEVVNQKPHPEQVQMVLEILNIPADNALYVGDSLIDGYAAKNASVNFLAVATGMTLPQQFDAVPCVGVVSSLKEILSFID